MFARKIGAMFLFSAVPHIYLTIFFALNVRKKSGVENLFFKNIFVSDKCSKTKVLPSQ